MFWLVFGGCEAGVPALDDFGVGVDGLGGCVAGGVARWGRWEVLVVVVGEGELTLADLVEKLNEAGCPCGPINSMDKTFADPQVQHLEIAKPVNHPELGPIDVVRMPINMPDVPNGLEIRRHAPERGEHSDEVLAEYGYGEEEIGRFRKAGVI